MTQVHYGMFPQSWYFFECVFENYLGWWADTSNFWPSRPSQLTKKNTTYHVCRDASDCTVLVHRMAHRKCKETKQLPSMLPGSAVPGCCLLSFHILWAILSTRTVYLDYIFTCPIWVVRTTYFYHTSVMGCVKFGAKELRETPLPPDALRGKIHAVSCP